MNHFPIAIAFSALSICTMTVPALAAPPSYNIQVGLANESFDPGDTDNYTQLTGSMRYSKGLSRNSVTYWNADIHTRSYDKIDSRDRNGLLLEAIYSFVPSAGFTKPVYSAGLRYETLDSDNSESNGNKTTFLISSTIRMDDSLTFTGGVEFLNKSFDAYDSDSIGLFLNLDKRLSSKTVVYTNLKLQQEESEGRSGSEAVSNSPSTSVRTAPREEFSMGHGGSGPTTFTSSRFDSDNSSWVLGINYFINSKHTIDLSVETVDYDTGTSLQSDTVSLDYFYKF